MSKNTFIKHTHCESCGSSDANAVYSDGSTFCFSCRKSTQSGSQEVKAEDMAFSVVQSNLSIEEIGNTMWISYLMAAAGGILGGLFTEEIIKRTSTDFGRKASIALGSLLIIIGFVSIILFVTESNYMTFIYLAGLALFGFQFAIGNIQTLSSDLFRGPSVGTLAGLAGTVAAFSPIIMNWFIGRITKGGSYTPAFIAITVSVVLAVFAVFFLIKKVGQVIKEEN